MSTTRGHSTEHTEATERTGATERTEPTETRTEPTETPRLAREEVFEVLSNRRRRYALHWLRQHDRAALGELSERVAAWETDQAVESLTADERKRVYTSLQQFHLPKMDETGIVAFDQRAGVVELGERAEEVDIYLEVTERYDVPWSLYYLGLTGVGTALAALSWAGVGPFAGVSDAGLVAFVLTALGLSALAHTAITRKMRLGREGPPPERDR